MCSVHTTCVCTTRVSTTRVCAPCEHHPCVHHLCVHTIRVCTIPVRTTRLPNTAHTPQAHTAVLHTSVPRRHGEAESPTASPSSPAAPLPTRRRHGALHIHRPRGDHRRPSPHPSVATGAARSGSGCAVCVAAPVAPADGGAGRTAASPPRSPAVPPPPPPVAVTAGWSGAAAPVLSPAGFRAATSETATKNTARPAVTSKPSGPGNESRSRAAPSRDRTSPRGRGNGAAAPRLSSTHPIARGVPAVSPRFRGCDRRRPSVRPRPSPPRGALIAVRAEEERRRRSAAERFVPSQRRRCQLRTAPPRPHLRAAGWGAQPGGSPGGSAGGVGGTARFGAAQRQ